MNKTMQALVGLNVKTRSVRLVRTAAVCLCFTAAIGISAQQPGTLESAGSRKATFTRFAVPGASGIVQVSINNVGTIAGYYFDNSDFVNHGFLREANGAITTFDAPGAGTGPGQGTYVSSINTSGTIAGFLFDASSNSHGFVREADGGITTFDVVGAAYTQAYSINAAGTITGEASGHGFVRTSGGAIRTFDVPGAVGTSPISINSSGTIVGSYSDANSTSHGFVRTADGAITTFDVPGAGTGSNQGTFPVSINVAGTTAGYYNVPTTYGFVRTADGTITTFNVPNALTTAPVSINAAGAVTGIYIDGNGVFYAFVRGPNGNIITFGPNIFPSSNNISGEITGTVGSDGFLLVP